MEKDTKKELVNTADLDKFKCICNECGRETTHKIVSSYNEEKVDYDDMGNGETSFLKNQIIECLGCETVSFRHESFDLDDCYYDDNGDCILNAIVNYYPKRSKKLKVIEYSKLPLNIQPIYKETILAVENKQNILAGIGMRAIIEAICKDLEVEEDKRDNLANKIDKLEKCSKISDAAKKQLHKLRELGNSSAHEAKAHSNTESLIEIIQHVLEGIYILPKINTEPNTFLSP
jgi:hypothetical protein